MYRIDNWINDGSGRIVELIESQYINISTYRPLSGWSCIILSVELKSPKKGLINFKYNNKKCFLWCHVIHINPVKIHLERITQEDKKLVNSLNYYGVGVPVREKEFSKIEKKSNICINVFCYENNVTFLIFVSDGNFENSMNLLLAIDENKLHYVYMRDFFTNKE